MPTCPNGHSTPRTSGCRYCTGQEVAEGYNDLATQSPALCAELVDPADGKRVTLGSGTSLRWKCDDGHIWEAPVNNRSRGRGCPYCTNRKVWPGFNDLATTHPDLAKSLISPKSTAVAAGSTAVGRWRCEVGHEWAASIRSRAKSGRACPYCSNKLVLAGFNDLATTHPDLVASWADPDKAPTEVTYGSKYSALWKCEKSHLYRASVADRQRSLRCATCAAKSYTSRFEKEVAEFVRSVLPGETVLTSHRGVRGVRELDIFLPERQFAIECNGVYFHSEAVRPDSYHVDKLAACNAAGIRLIQVWEDDWEARRAIVENMLRHKLGRSELPRYSARKLTPRFVPLAEARTFLETHHIQGWASGTYYIALVDDAREPVALMALKRQGRRLVLERYATSGIVAGGQSKLLRYLEAEVDGWDSIVTFADLEISDGGLYEVSGWVKEASLPADYKYAVRGERKHKFGYRLKRFRDDPTLVYEDGLTERELASLNGLLRVWDSGKVRYAWHRQ